MNILAHIHLAALSNTSVIGNAAADFIKGDPYRQYTPFIADGIMMHRRVDKLVDELPEIEQAKLLFRSETRRVAPITLDIVWDHFLSKHWACYMQQSLPDFNLSMQKLIKQDIALFPVEFKQFMGYLWQNEWLVNYAHQDFIKRVLNGMANERPKLEKLRVSFTDFTDNYAQLEQLFFIFYPRLIKKAQSAQL
ncbi:acyl carrier protein phosphodiesterase [Orbus mooreae]|uniref:acyl carrier protein phosphodiesterase n=1 Tax=Orbus mooreae TaxID=3074107 RepID=UPI00370DBFAD